MNFSQIVQEACALIINPTLDEPASQSAASASVPRKNESSFYFKVNRVWISNIIHSNWDYARSDYSASLVAFDLVSIHLLAALYPSCKAKAAWAVPVRCAAVTSGVTWHCTRATVMNSQLGWILRADYFLYDFEHNSAPRRQACAFFSFQGKYVRQFSQRIKYCVIAAVILHFMKPKENNDKLSL